MAHKLPVTGDETLVNLTECGICLSEMKNPKALPCLHSFCLECLKEVKHPPGIFICPLCQEQMSLPSGGVDGLRDNFFINQLKDWKAIQKIGEVKTPCVCCKSADQDTKARCMDCNGFLCQLCVSSHKTLTPLAGHKVFSIDELRSGQIDMSTMIKEETCQTHTDQVLRWFCKTCKIPICRDCTVMDHVRPDHDYITIESATQEQTKEIETLMSNCKGLSKQFKGAIGETEDVKNNLNKAVDNIMRELDQERKAYMEAIQISYDENVEKLVQIQKEQLEKITSTRKGLDFMQSKLNNAIEIASQVIISGSKHTVASNYSTLCTTLTKLQDSKQCGINKNVCMVKFKPIQKHSKKVVLIGEVSTGVRFRDGTGMWIFEKDIGNKGDTIGAYGIAVSPNSLYHVADYDKSNVAVFDQEGKMKQEIKANLTNPIDIAVTSSEFYVADRTSYIKRFSYDGNYIRQFPAISPDGKASDTDGSKLYGIANDNDGNMLVGNDTKKYISKHRPDGTHISSFPISIQPWFLKATANGSIVVTSFRYDVPVQILDPYGKLLHTINKPKDAIHWNPSGIACCDDGSVFITNYRDGIYHFTEDGEYIGRVIKDKKAIGLVISDDDKLVMARYDGLPSKIYTYKEQ